MGEDEGPKVFYDTDEDAYQDFLKKKGAWPWYAQALPRFRPGAFTHTDGDAEPDKEDHIWFGPAEWRALLRAVEKDFQDLTKEEHEAVELAHHEWLHNLVPGSGFKGKPKQPLWWLKENCSHPKEAIPAVRHAFRTKRHTNAFTRLLRHRVSVYRYDDFANWLPKAVKEAKPRA